MQELIEDDDCGFLVESDEPARLARAVLKAVDLEKEVRTRVTATGRAKVDEKYSFGAAAAAFQRELIRLHRQQPARMTRDLRGPRTATAMSARAELLTRKLNQHVGDNWLHQFELRTDGEVSSPQNLSHRQQVLEGLFATLFAERSVLVLEEASGVYPALIKRAGAQAVAASSPYEATRDLISEVSEFLEAQIEIIPSRVVGFFQDEPYVDMQYGSSYEFLLALGRLWPMYRASGGSFDAVVEACAHVVTDGLVLDWTDATWASPPPEYTRAAFCEALEKKFGYVTVYSDWLVVALGKLGAPAI
jgi:hypothetical protein